MVHVDGGGVRAGVRPARHVAKIKIINFLNVPQWCARIRYEMGEIWLELRNTISMILDMVEPGEQYMQRVQVIVLHNMVGIVYRRRRIYLQEKMAIGRINDKKRRTDKAASQGLW